MSDYLSRMKLELDELGDRLKKLQGFINSDSFEVLSVLNRMLLKTQMQAMATYHEVLELRITLNDPDIQ